MGLHVPPCGVGVWSSPHLDMFGLGTKPACMAAMPHATLLTAGCAAAVFPGGAYPELPLLQYPLDMGRPDEQRGKQTLAVAVDIEGNANYDAIVRQGARANKVIHTGHQALIPKLDLMDPSVSDTH